jgi:hypothetical protein
MGWIDIHRWYINSTVVIAKALECARVQVHLKDGGREGIRTPGLLVANEALSQLSYSPTSSNSILANAPVLANTGSIACNYDWLSTYLDIAWMLRAFDTDNALCG